MTPAMPADRAWIEAHLRAHITTSMFPLANLAQHGWESDAPRAMRFWIDRSANALLGMSVEGMLMPQAPGHDFSGARPALAGRTTMGAVGEAGQVRALLSTLGLTGCATKIDEDEPQFLLPLADFAIPEGPGHLIPLSEAAPKTMADWRADYLSGVAGEDPDRAGEQAAGDIARYIAADSHRVLVSGDTPLALTGFNAALPDIVQVGGVYTPPALRGRGHARRAVALHLAEARASGVTQATLFAAGPAAVRAYEALGFHPIGTFALVLFRAPEEIAP